MESWPGSPPWGPEAAGRFHPKPRGPVSRPGGLKLHRLHCNPLEPRHHPVRLPPCLRTVARVPRRPGVRASSLEGEGRKGAVSRPKQSRGRVTATAEEGRHGCVAPTRMKLIARGDLSPTRGGVQPPYGCTNGQEGGASVRSRGRDADCEKAREPVRPNEASPLRERAMKKRPEGRGSHREVRVCRRPEAQSHRSWEKRPQGFRARSRPHRPSPGSPNAVRSAGTGPPRCGG